MEAPLLTTQLKADTTLQNGKYRIVRELGHGGFGITYLAEHQVFGEVALKELFINSGDAHCSRENTTQKHVIPHFDRPQFELFKKRFSDEAKTLYSLNDIRGVVNVIDIFEENGTAYFSMEYLRGEKLDDYIKKKGRLSEAETRAMLTQLCATMSAVHARKVLHRDIKPANIIITTDGRAVLIDFGIARSYVENSQTHTTFHTPRYSPPEQKIAKSKMGDYSDVYAIGATAYYMATGVEPQSVDDLTQEDFIAPKSIVPTLSDNLNDSIVKSLKMRFTERFETVSDLLNALNAVPTPKTDEVTTEKPRASVAGFLNFFKKAAPSVSSPKSAKIPAKEADKTEIQAVKPIETPLKEADKTEIQAIKVVETPLKEADKTQIQAVKPAATPLKEADKTEIQAIKPAATPLKEADKTEIQAIKVVATPLKEADKTEIQGVKVKEKRTAQPFKMPTKMVLAALSSVLVMGLVWFIFFKEKEKTIEPPPVTAAPSVSAPVLVKTVEPLPVTVDTTVKTIPKIVAKSPIIPKKMEKTTINEPTTSYEPPTRSKNVVTELPDKVRSTLSLCAVSGSYVNVDIYHAAGGSRGGYIQTVNYKSIIDVSFLVPGSYMVQCTRGTEVLCTKKFDIGK